MHVPALTQKNTIELHICNTVGRKGLPQSKHLHTKSNCCAAVPTCNTSCTQGATDTRLQHPSTAPKKVVVGCPWTAACAADCMQPCCWQLPSPMLLRQPHQGLGPAAAAAEAVAQLLLAAAWGTSRHVSHLKGRGNTKERAGLSKKTMLHSQHIPCTWFPGALALFWGRASLPANSSNC